jgi:hypothetical protein
MKNILVCFPDHFNNANCPCIRLVVENGSQQIHFCHNTLIVEEFMHNKLVFSSCATFLLAPSMTLKILHNEAELLEIFRMLHTVSTRPCSNVNDSAVICKGLAERFEKKHFSTTAGNESPDSNVKTSRFLGKV